MKVVPNCFEAIQDLELAMDKCLAPDQRYFVLGGISTSAMKHPDTYFDHDSRVVYAPDESAESVIRENGTTRDVDILIDGVLPNEQADNIRATVAEAVPDLKISIFGFDEHRPVLTRRERIGRAFKEWTSKRTVDEDGNLHYELYPLSQQVQPESYEQWKLVAGEEAVTSVLNPAGHLLAYKMRSISGVRPKDIPKLTDLNNRVMSDETFQAQIRDGIYKEWREFANFIVVMRDSSLKLAAGLACHSAGIADVAAFLAKSRALHRLERNEHLVKLAQTRLGEKILDPIVGSK